MSMAIFSICYLLAGVFCWFTRTVKVGKHRAEHGGKMDNSCLHWACDLMADDAVISACFILLWPIAQPLHDINRLTRWIIRIQHERSLPPKNEGPGRVVDNKFDGPKH